MQNILIPTNFSVQSLDCVSSLCEQCKGAPLRLVSVHMFKISDSIADLLMLSRRNKEYSYISTDFYDTCDALKVRYPQLVIHIEFFYGSSMNNFNDFLETAEIDAILEPSSCIMTKLNASSTDPLLFINKSRIPLISIPAAKQNTPVAAVAEGKVMILEEELLAG